MVLDVVRHAESVYNQIGKSGPDCPLSADGMLQARCLSGDYDCIVCSPMRRTRQTLELSSITYRELMYEDLARERRDDVCDFMHNEPQERETFIAFADRMRRLNCRLTALERSHGRVLLVAHAYVLLALLRIRSGKTLPLDFEEQASILKEYTSQVIPNAEIIHLDTAVEQSSANDSAPNEHSC